MKRSLSRAVFSYCALSAGLTGCLAEAPGEPGESSVVDAISADNGKSLNGISLNGTTLNGKSLNGKSVNGISLNGMSLGSVNITGVSVSNTQLRGTKSTGGAISGAQFVGAAMKGSLADGTPFDIRIDSSATLPAPNGDIRTYTISYSTTTGWQPLCTDPSFGNQAILFPGSWNLTTVKHQADYNLFSVGCRGATFAKCEELGYKGDAMVDTYLEACIRAIRADYCGDGVSHTVDGTLINIYDKSNIQHDTQAWTIESNWSESGSICIKKPRIASTLAAPVPDCLASRAAIVCTAPAWPAGVLIRTEVP